MNKLNHLIDEMCPNGVNYFKLNEVCGTITTGKLNANAMKDNGLYPFFTCDANPYRIDSYAFDTTAIIISGNGSQVGHINYYQGKFNAYQRTYILTDFVNIDPSYIHHYLKAYLRRYISTYAKKGSVPYITMPMLESFIVPVPPIEIQLEIVRILDKFTELLVELTAELTARKQQYEYYRYMLLNDRSVSTVSLKSVVKRSSSGSTPAKGVSAFYEKGTIPWLRTQDVKFNEIYEINSFITEEAVKKTSAKWIPENCVIVAISGATAGRCAINKIATTTNQHCLNLEINNEKALYKYIYYCVYSKYDELISRKQGARGDLNSTLILGIEIPLPPLETQQRIVDILDKFDKLVNDINEGLPAEIAARQKQYEYYRDKLLTFKEVGNESI